MKKAIVPLGIIVLLIFGVFMYVNRFTLFHTVEVEGIVFDSTDLTTNLTGGVTKESNKITYKNIKINDNIEIATKTKKELNSILKKRNAILNEVNVMLQKSQDKNNQRDKNFGMDR